MHKKLIIANTCNRPSVWFLFLPDRLIKSENTKKLPLWIRDSHSCFLFIYFFEASAVRIKFPLYNPSFLPQLNRFEVGPDYSRMLSCVNRPHALFGVRIKHLLCFCSRSHRRAPRAPSQDIRTSNTKLAFGLCCFLINFTNKVMISRTSLKSISSALTTTLLFVLVSLIQQSEDCKMLGKPSILQSSLNCFFI